jgi:hypothetical protein
MDDSDRTEPEVLPVAIPEHLVFAIDEWLEDGSGRHPTRTKARRRVSP